MRLTVNFRMVLIVALLPLALVGLFWLLALAQGMVRYDPAYFTPLYVERYETPGSAARVLEGALQTNDQELLAELQGKRRPAAFETSPQLTFTMLWERGERYISYLYFDMQTYHRQMHYFEEVQGRWVVSPVDVYFYWHSGRWTTFFLPLAGAWWALGTVALLALWAFRASERIRARMYGG